MRFNKDESQKHKKFSSASKESGARASASFTSAKSKDKEKISPSLKSPSQKLKLRRNKTGPENAGRKFAVAESTGSDAGRTELWQTHEREQEILEKDFRPVNRDNQMRGGHSLTYIGLFLFTLVLYFRPYELIPALSSLDMMAQVIAIATLLIYLPTQITREGSLTALTTEVKCLLIMVACAIFSIVIAKDSGLAWKTFSEHFSKVAVITIVMLNVLRTKRQLQGLMWLAVAISVWLSYQAVVLYQEGVFEAEGYRVKVDFGGMFGNPNDMAMFLVIVTPIAIALGFASKFKLAKLLYFLLAALMIAGNFVTQSRGAFLGLIAMTAVLVWKLGRKQRIKSIIITILAGSLVITLAPGNYWIRILSIFIPGLDPVGSSDQRTDLLIQSFWVSLRNPLGIGIGNFPIVGIRNLETHNSYTQVSAEIGLIALAAYLFLLIAPLRKLGFVQRQMIAREDFSWGYYAAIGVQASIITYMVSSFFGAVAYNWYGYYLIAYAACLHRIYQFGMNKGEDSAQREEPNLTNHFSTERT